jgi:hypothetical protein
MGSLQTWEQTVSQKRALRDQALKPYLVTDIDARSPRVQDVQNLSCFTNDPLAQEITDIDSIPALVGKLQKGTWTAEQVIRAYIRR